jgi:5-(carboxyamino)imidazole ribonucleotide synthase
MIVGVLGGGQLGRMLALAGYPLGLRFRFLEMSADVPVADVGELLVGSYDDPGLLERFARSLEVATYEFENVPVTGARLLAERVPLYPPAEALEVAQDRLTEKQFFQSLGIPTPSFAAVDTKDDLTKAMDQVGLPAVLKTRRLGYDGKGQFTLHKSDNAARAWEVLGGVPLLLERFVPFEWEVSILAVRGRADASAFYPLVENHHQQGILRLSLAPAPRATPELQARAEDYATRVLDKLDYAGVLAIEFFQLGGELLANEMAPRVHNSGHWTIEGAETSQFENHLRAILGLPLGSTRAVGHSAMMNLIGVIPDRRDILSVKDARLHLYGKPVRLGRKLGHITVVGDSVADREARLAELARIIRV